MTPAPRARLHAKCQFKPVIRKRDSFEDMFRAAQRASHRIAIIETPRTVTFRWFKRTPTSIKRAKREVNP
jgi:hypothetical protein